MVKIWTSEPKDIKDLRPGEAIVSIVMMVGGEEVMSCSFSNLKDDIFIRHSRKMLVWL